jgi:hypothetical protein
VACQIFQWLIAGTDRTTLEHASIGIGCLMAFELINRWRKPRALSGQVAVEEQASAAADERDFEQRRAA